MKQLSNVPAGYSGRHIPICFVVFVLVFAVAGCSASPPDTSDSSKSFANVRASRRTQLAQARAAKTQQPAAQAAPTQGTP